MSGSNGSGGETSPTVSREKWEVHALRKLAKGYVLIVSRERKNANFHSPTKGYEMCAFRVAKKLVNDGLVEKTRDHHLGSVYELKSEVRDSLKKGGKPMPKDEDDDEKTTTEDTEALLDDIPELDDDELDLDDLDEEEEEEEDNR